MNLRTFIERPILSAVISISIVVVGIIGLFTLPVEQYPDIAPPTIQVSTSYFGASAETLQKSVIAPLEEAINGVENMTYMTSTASNAGVVDITVYFKQGTDPDMAAVNVQNRVSKATGQLPAEVTQVGVPDMRIPIQYALTYPQRLPSPVQELSLVDYGKLTFYAPDYDTFRCINVCKDAIAAGGLRPAAANGANEESVRLFLNGKIKFTDIAVLNRAAMEACPQVADYTLDDVLQADRAARDYVIEAVS